MCPLSKIFCYIINCVVFLISVQKWILGTHKNGDGSNVYLHSMTKNKKNYIYSCQQQFF